MFKVTAKPYVLENIKRSWNKSWKVMEFEELKGVRALNALFFAITIALFVLIIKFCSPGP